MLKANVLKKISSLFLVVFLLPSPAVGQALLEEIVVTASKRDAQDLQSADSTISAFSGEALGNTVPASRYSPDIAKHAVLGSEDVVRDYRTRYLRDHHEALFTE